MGLAYSHLLLSLSLSLSLCSLCPLSPSLPLLHTQCFFVVVYAVWGPCHVYRLYFCVTSPQRQREETLCISPLVCQLTILDVWLIVLVVPSHPSNLFSNKGWSRETMGRRGEGRHQQGSTSGCVNKSTKAQVALCLSLLLLRCNTLS